MIRDYYTLVTSSVFFSSGVFASFHLLCAIKAIMNTKVACTCRVSLFQPIIQLTFNFPLWTLNKDGCFLLAGLSRWTPDVILKWYHENIKILCQLFFVVFFSLRSLLVYKRNAKENPFANSCRSKITPQKSVKFFHEQPHQDPDRDFCVDLSVIEMVSVSSTCIKGIYGWWKSQKAFPRCPLIFLGKR